MLEPGLVVDLGPGWGQLMAYDLDAVLELGSGHHLV
jgi:hypothetical protein